MRLLFITPSVPYPLDNGGRIRVYNLLKSLAHHHEISLVAVAVRYTSDPITDFESARQALSKLCRRVEIVPNILGRSDILYRLGKSLTTTTPEIISDLACAEARQIVRRVLVEDQIELIHAEQLHVAPYALFATGLPKVLAEQNVEFRVWRDYAFHYRTLLHRLLSLVEWQKLLRYEPWMCRHFDCIVAVSEPDRVQLQRLLPQTPVVLVPNGVDLDYFDGSDTVTAPDENTLVFTGTMAYGPNEDAMLYFHRTIFPLVKQRVPEAKLLIVGQSPPRRILELSNDTDTIVTGYVPDTRPYLRRAKVFVVPARIGGGPRLKVVEAMAQGVPVVATPAGAEGLDVTPGENILVAEAPGEFAAHVVNLLRDDTRRVALARKARRLVEEHYSWDKLGARLNEVYTQVSRGNVSR